jgi:hypothetical protein
MVTGTYVDATDPNTVIVVMDMETLDAAQQFAASPELGVVGTETDRRHLNYMAPSHPPHWPRPRRVVVVPA